MMHIQIISTAQPISFLSDFSTFVQKWLDSVLGKKIPFNKFDKNIFLRALVSMLCFLLVEPWTRYANLALKLYRFRNIAELLLYSIGLILFTPIVFLSTLIGLPMALGFLSYLISNLSLKYPKASKLYSALKEMPVMPFISPEERDCINEIIKNEHQLEILENSPSPPSVFDTKITFIKAWGRSIILENPCRNTISKLILIIEIQPFLSTDDEAVLRHLKAYIKRLDEYPYPETIPSELIPEDVSRLVFEYNTPENDGVQPSAVPYHSGVLERSETTAITSDAERFNGGDDLTTMMPGDAQTFSR